VAALACFQLALAALAHACQTPSSLKSALVVKTAAAVSLQLFGAAVAFTVSLVFTNAIVPLPQALRVGASPVSGFLSLPAAALFNAAVNATILVWAGRRSSFHGFGMWMQLAALSFGTQTLQTQIETGYFLSAFPQLAGSFALYVLIARGLVTSLLFTLGVTALVGGFGPAPRPVSRFDVSADHAVKAGAWLGLIYCTLYLLFGYYVAWQSRDVRLFYGGPAELNSFMQQLAATLMARPELPVFQYFRGVLWLLCLIPLFKGFAGTRRELIAFSALALAYLPSAQLAFPNPLMPPGISLTHFWEVSISTGLFGALCAFVAPTQHRSLTIL
jgi:hypothetical protein